jgi:3'-phosphoadenosine 5'-phosphosulfate synthase
VVDAPVDSRSKVVGRFGSKTFRLFSTEYDSMWHDVRLRPSGDSGDIINMVTEIPMYYTSKMEVQKKLENNPIAQDTNDDGSSRYYTYGTPFFNYGFIPQTWEDPDLKSSQGYGGDNDPLDVMEIGSTPLRMGSIQPCRVLGSLELIDEGETDHKIICIALNDKDASSIQSLEDLERVKPGHIDTLKDWLKRYKTSDGKPENSLASEIPKTTNEAMAVIEETHVRWKTLCGKDGTSVYQLGSKVEGFYLNSLGCRAD